MNARDLLEFQSPLRRFFYFHPRFGGGPIRLLLVSISFAEIFLFPRTLLDVGGEVLILVFQSPLRRFFYFHNCAGCPPTSPGGAVSISFAEIFLFPHPGVSFIAKDRSGGFNLLCGDFFISTHLPSALPQHPSLLFQSPLRRFFYFHKERSYMSPEVLAFVSISFAEIFLFPPRGSSPPWRKGDGCFNLLCGDFFISTFPPIRFFKASVK